MKLWLHQFAWALRAMLARRRTWMGFGAFLLIDLLFLGLMQSDNLRDAARNFYLKNPRFAAPENFSGLTLALFILNHSVDWLAPLFLALVASDAVAKEVEDGTMRMILGRPVSRGRLLCMRWLGCNLYACVLTLFFCAVALGSGWLDQGSGNLLVMFAGQRTPIAYAAAAGLARYALAMPLLAAGMLTVSSIAFLFSCLPLRPNTAAIAAASLLFGDRFLREAPFFKVFHPWFLTTRIDHWRVIYTPQIPWNAIAENCLILLAIDLLLLTAGCVVFSRRDLKP